MEGKHKILYYVIVTEFLFSRKGINSIFIFIDRLQVLCRSRSSCIHFTSFFYYFNCFLCLYIVIWVWNFSVSIFCLYYVLHKTLKSHLRVRILSFCRSLSPFWFSWPSRAIFSTRQCQECYHEAHKEAESSGMLLCTTGLYICIWKI